MENAAIFSIFPVLVVFAGASDLLTMTIPNRVSILLILAFGLMGVLAGFSVQEWGIHLLGGAAVFLPCFIMFFLGWMGGGDAKVASAIALWFGFGASLTQFLLLTTIYGMALTLGILAFRLIPVLPGFCLGQGWLLKLHDKQTGIPYGIAISAAALHTYSSSAWFDLLS
ncbi:prepilin peptidase [Roseibium polysiphoniae]|uniref:Prepilin peptidase n=1 Tax=Roseibium polysiphoniae TaxID=2571221 RepID=A0ABR9CEK5_9HYPH|nr:prepilin peptidase [Roseibium polysiphoniae]MBD8878320.1 prepilin peptidase [Roseibium polysiphoniae]